MEKRRFGLEDTPYSLRIENVAGYAEDCHFCEDSRCRQCCALPYSSKTTVLDLLKKLDVQDNISYFNEGKGRKDVTLAFIWSSDFQTGIQKLLSSVHSLNKTAGDDDLDENKDITIDDCFNEFKKSEILDEQNKWYCNKCKDHV